MRTDLCSGASATLPRVSGEIRAQLHAEDHNLMQRLCVSALIMAVHRSYMQRAVHDWFGPILPLLWGTPWEVMRDWVARSPPIVRIRILMRPCVVVGSAAGLKRIFQVGAV